MDGSEFDNKRSMSAVPAASKLDGQKEAVTAYKIQNEYGTQIKYSIHGMVSMNHNVLS